MKQKIMKERKDWKCEITKRMTKRKIKADDCFEGIGVL